MTPVIVSAKVMAIIVAGVSACLNHAVPGPLPGSAVDYHFESGWESCEKIMAFNSRMELPSEAAAAARQEAADKAAVVAASKVIAGTAP
mgnify:FL=1